MMLGLSLIFNVVLVVMVVSLFKKWWETDDDLERCERQLEKCESCLEEWQEAYSCLEVDYEDLRDEFDEFYDKTVKALKRLHTEINDRDDLIEGLYEEIEILEENLKIATDGEEPETIEVEEYEVMPEILFLMAPVLTEAEQIVEDAKVEADKIVAEARAKADQIIANAEIKLKEMLSKVNKYKKPSGKPVKPQIVKSKELKRPVPPKISNII